jgi:hypothetical protein
LSPLQGPAASCAPTPARRWVSPSERCRPGCGKTSCRAFPSCLLASDAQTVFSIILFYGLGFGLFATLERWQLALICLAVWAFQIGFSVLWLRSFRYGPLEWLWRSLIDGRLRSMRLG